MPLPCQRGSQGQQVASSLGKPCLVNWAPNDRAAHLRPSRQEILLVVLQLLVLVLFQVLLPGRGRTLGGLQG